METIRIVILYNTLVLVSKAPRPQNVPPPIELPPIRSNLSSDSTCTNVRSYGESQIDNFDWT